MMKSPEMRLAARAMLRAQWELQENESYIGLFVPFAVASIAKDGRQMATIKEVRKGLKDDFEFDVPEDVVEFILRRAHRMKFGMLVSVNGEGKRDTFRVSPRCSAPEFEEARRVADIEQEALTASLQGFAMEAFSTQLTSSQAASLVSDFVEQNIVGLIDSLKNDSNSPSVDQRSIVGSWLRSILSGDDQLRLYIRNVVVGAMLSAALHVENVNEVNRRFDDLRVVLDTPTLLDLIGLNGSEAKAATVESTNLLRSTGARLVCWDHTTHEVSGVLRAAARGLRKGTRDVGDFTTVEIEAARSGRSSGSLTELANRATEAIEALGVTVEQVPAINESLTLDEEAGLEFLMEGFETKRKQQAEYDLDSFTAVYRARKGRSTTRLESAGYVLTTTNRRLAKLESSLLPQSRGVRIVVPFSSLVTLAWLKKPREAPDLSLVQLAADAYAASQPSTLLVRKAMQEASLLSASGKADEVDLGRLRFEAETHEILVRRTGGVPARATAEAVRAAIEERREKEKQAKKAAASSQAEADAMAARLRALEGQQKDELEAFNARLAESEERLDQQLWMQKQTFVLWVARAASGTAYALALIAALTLGSPGRWIVGGACLAIGSCVLAIRGKVSSQIQVCAVITVAIAGLLFAIVPIVE